MKNLKKVLALVLVIASLMGMATMASATKSDDYSDADSITHIEAVDVMSTIGVFDGISGAFSGDSILTREQAAKIITYMILGKDDADALVASVAPYTDVSRDRWSAGSIAYCKNAGILAGVGNGRFEPDGKLTGVAFAKMCLVALGYDPEIEKLTGSQWAVNTSTIAIAGAGITGNLSQVSLADEMSREDACQMAFNTLQADMVDYDNRGSVIIAGDVTVNTNPSKAQPVSVETGWQDVAGKRNDGNIDGDGIQQFAEKYFTNLKKFSVTDSFGRPSTEWSYKANKIGTYVKNSQLVQTWTAKASKGDLYNAIGSSSADKIYKVDQDTDAKRAMTVYVDGIEKQIKDGNTNFKKEDFIKKNSTAAIGDEISGSTNIGFSGNGVLTELYMNSDGKIDVVMINTYLVKATSDYNTVNERVSIEAMPIDGNTVDGSTFLPTSISNEDFDVTGVKEDDYLLLTVSFDDSWGKSKGCTIESVTPATVQTATVTEYTEKENVVMGGTKYEYNKILGDDEKGELFAINSDATLILDTYGYIMYVDEAFSTNNFVYVSKIGKRGAFENEPVADAYFTDGSNNEILLNKVTILSNTDPKRTTYNKSQIFANAQRNAIPAGWYTFSGTSGSQYTLRTPDLSRYDLTQSSANGVYATSGDTIIKGGSVTFMSSAKLGPDGTDTSFNVKKVKANDKTVFVIKADDGDVSAYVGVSNAPDVKSSSAGVHVSYIKRSNSEYASFVFIDAFNTGATIDEVGGTADYMFVLKETNNETHVDGLTYYKYKVVVDGKEEERWVAAGAGVEVGTLYKNIKEDSNGRITSAKAVSGTTSRQWESTLTDAKFTRSGSTMNIAYNTTEDVNLIVDSKSEINLVLGKPSSSSQKNDLLVEYADGESYKVDRGVSASYVASILDSNEYQNICGHIYLIRADEDSEVIDKLWIYVNGSSEK